MAAYRAEVSGVIIREFDGYCPDRNSHDCTRGHLAAVVVNGDRALAERIVALLNGDEAGEPSECGCPTAAIKGRLVRHDRRCPQSNEARRFVIPEHADSCTCPPPYGTSAAADPECPVHHGRRARGPKPPPLGPGCICDGSGRTCPRHGAVI